MRKGYSVPEGKLAKLEKLALDLDVVRVKASTLLALIADIRGAREEIDALKREEELAAGEPGFFGYDLMDL